MTSKYVSSKVEDSVTFLQNSINTFLRLQNDEEVETESETTTPRIELENIACHREDNIWVKYWGIMFLIIANKPTRHLLPVLERN